MGTLDAGDPLTALPNVNAARAQAFARMGILSVEDLLRLAPRRYEDRRVPTPLASLEKGQAVFALGRVVQSKSFRTRGGLSILEAVIEDESGAALARWFYRGFRPRPLEAERRVALYGVVDSVTKGRATFKAPEYEYVDEEVEDGPGVARFVPVHPRTTGLSATGVRRAVWHALPATPTVPDLLPEGFRASAGVPALAGALRDLHFPETLEDAEVARARLALDELLVHELLLADRRLARERLTAPAIPIDARVHARIADRLPFRLTDGQQRAVQEILGDLARTVPMYRLLQGDVGSGKTAVAVYALLGAVARGRQGVFMAPTEVLARQHAETLAGWLAGSRVRTELLVGGRRSKARREALARIAAGEVDLVIGTHAVLGDDVRFADLALVVVDEQHKFGVRQRRGLVAKGGARPHCLVMTATPIPRTLALTVWGDLDVSVISGRLPGRTEVETRVVTPAEGRALLAEVRDALQAGRQAYVIYPLVEESEKLALRDAEDGHARWVRALPDHRVGLLHGRMKRDEKEAVMADFRSGAVHLLVATVVVEVGVDVPNATLLLVEHAERFGLSQLHQLRGRIGRGKHRGVCLLMDRSKADTPARLDVLARTTDGFEIAEEDCKLRGVGDLFGTRQHGRPPFHAAALPRDLPVLESARRLARRILAEDPGLARPAHALLRRHVEARRRVLDTDEEEASTPGKMTAG